jgi:uncharacterized protein (DUF58 family)
MGPNRKLALTREGWTYAVVTLFVLAGAVLREGNLLMLLTGMLTGLFCFGLVLSRATLRNLEVRRVLPEGISAGDRLVVEISVKNRRRHWGSWAVTVADQVKLETDGSGGSGQALSTGWTQAEQRALAGRGALTGGGSPGEQAAANSDVSVFLPQVLPGKTAQAAYQGRLLRRGRYRFGPLKVSSRFPSTFFRASLKLSQPDTLLVTPRLGRLMPRWAQMYREDEQGSQQSGKRQGLVEAEFYGLRDWRNGDSRRWIHWRSSARRGSVVVRQFDERRNQDLMLLLDLWQPRQPSAEQSDNVELAVSFAATVLADACRRGGNHLLLVFAGQQLLHRRGWTSPIFLREMMEMLALLQPHHEDRLPRALSRAVGEARPGVHSLMVSTRPVDWAPAGLPAGSAAVSNSRRRVVIDTSHPGLAEFFQPT